MAVGVFQVGESLPNVCEAPGLIPQHHMKQAWLCALQPQH